MSGDSLNKAREVLMTLYEGDNDTKIRVLADPSCWTCSSRSKHCIRWALLLDAKEKGVDAKRTTYGLAYRAARLQDA